jgi:hypothetical protein
MWSTDDLRIAELTKKPCVSEKGQRPTRPGALRKTRRTRFDACAVKRGSQKGLGRDAEALRLAKENGRNMKTRYSVNGPDEKIKYYF